MRLSTIEHKILVFYEVLGKLNAASHKELYVMVCKTLMKEIKAMGCMFKPRKYSYNRSMI